MIAFATSGGTEFRLGPWTNCNSSHDEPLLLLLKGLAGCGKSYVIDALRNLLLNKCRVLAYTGKAACNVNGITLHSLLKLPIGSKRLGDLKGIALQQLQTSLEGVRYLILVNSQLRILHF